MMNFEVYPWHKLCSYLLFCFVWSGVCMDEQVDLISTHKTTSDIIGFFLANFCHLFLFFLVEYSLLQFKKNPKKNLKICHVFYSLFKQVARI